MRSSRTVIITLVLVLLVLLFGVLYFASRPTNIAVTPMPSPVPTTQPLESPTPSQQIIDGEILSISDDTIGFMNSLVATILQDNGSAVLVYITENTVVTDAQGEEIERTTLSQGDEMQIVAQPTEGGFEAIRIQTVGVTVAPTIPQATAVPIEPTETPQE